MSQDLRKLKDSAVLFERKDKLAKALEAYTELSRLEAGNPRWLQKTGEIHKRLGHTEAAVAAFAEAARRLAEDGFLVKAIALCKVILGLNPRHVETQDMLARLYSANARPAGRPRPAPVAPAVPRETPTSAEVLVVEEGTDVPSAEEEFTPRKHRTIPQGASLDSVKLSVVLPDARRPEGSQVFEIPLEDEVDTAFAETTLPEAPPQPPAADFALRPRITPLFSSLDEGALRTLIGKVTVRSFGEGEKIITEGQEGDSLYVLVEGEVAIYREGAPRVEVGHLAEGAFFGEIGLLTQFRRTATVEAMTEVTLLEITRETMSDLVEAHPEVLKVLLRFFRHRLIDTLVATSDLFAPFAADERRVLASRFTFIEAEADTEILQESRPADGLYVLLCGVLEAIRRTGHDAGRVAVLGPGRVVGEASLLTGTPAEATVTTRSKCWLLRLERAVFQEVIMTHPQVLAFLADLADRATGEERQLPFL
jgi:CRP-like cAMP-binding protein